MEAIKSFWKICNEAGVAYEKSYYDRPALDKFGVQLIDLINKNKDLKADFEQAFIELYYKNQDMPWELIPFCMHTFKWQSLKTSFEILLKKSIECNDLRSEPILEDILDSFNEEWEDIDLHPHYSKS